MKNIKREFFVFNNDQTLVLENPLSVHFINCYSGALIGTAGSVIINNVMVLTPFFKTLGTSGGPLIIPDTDSTTPYELKLENNDNELDTTQYTIRFFTNTPDNRLFVIVKYRKA